jgi:methenyltetrahydromethanopterin cyclohydrolase
MISINREAMKTVRRVLADPDALDVKVSQLANGATVIDMGREAGGGWQAGLDYTQVTLGGLGRLSYEVFPVAGRALPAVRVMVDRPMEACVASQIAGWQLDPPGTPGAAIAAGPARALNRLHPDHYFELIAYRDQHDEAVVAIQTAQPITAHMADVVAENCQVRTGDVYILTAPNASLVCAVQVAARIIEQTLHRLPEEGFDFNQVKYAEGYAVIAPLSRDEAVAMGRINDSLLYGGVCSLYVEADDDAVAAVTGRITSSVSRAYGRPFLEIFEEAGHDFYQIPLDLHSPAAVQVNNLRTGRSFSAGRINYDVLEMSFFGG